MKKRLMILLSGLVLIVVFSLVLLNKQPQTIHYQTKETMEPIASEDKIWFISDIHYLSPKLHDEGSKFQFIKNTAAGKELDYQTERLEALVWQVAKEKPKMLVVSGDLTLNGEQQSAADLATYFADIQALGTKVLVIPGNHDISDGWARAYQGDEALPTEQISPNDFKDIFAEMGYQDAYATDEHSLSYVAKPYENLWMLMIDTNEYTTEQGKGSPKTGGKVKPSTIKWLKEILKKAQEEQVTVIPVMHHNLMNHHPLVYKNFTIDNSEDIQKLFAEYQLDLTFTGHIHAQNIASKEIDGQLMYDIASGSFAIPPNSIGELTIGKAEMKYQQKSLAVASWAEATNRQQADLLNYPAYSTQLFQKDGAAMAYSEMYDEGWYDEAYADEVAQFVGKVNLRFFSGTSEQSVQEIEKLKKEPGYQLIQQHSKGFLKKYVDSILVDKIIDTQLIIPKMK